MMFFIELYNSKEKKKHILLEVVKLQPLINFKWLGLRKNREKPFCRVINFQQNL